MDAGDSVHVNNSGRHSGKTADGTLTTIKGVLSSPISNEPYASLTSSSPPPPPPADDRYFESGGFLYHTTSVTLYLAITHKHRLSTKRILKDHIFHKVLPTLIGCADTKSSTRSSTSRPRLAQHGLLKPRKPSLRAGDPHYRLMTWHSDMLLKGSRRSMLEKLGKVLEVMRAVISAKWIVKRCMKAAMDRNKDRRRKQNEL